MLMTSLSVSTLLQKMVQFGEDTYDEESCREALPLRPRAVQADRSLDRVY